MVNDGDGPEIGADNLDPDTWSWLPGVDYVTGWREAKDAADVLNTALAACGLRREDVRATADTGADGRGVVRLRGTPFGVRKLARVLAEADRARRGRGRGCGAA